MDRWTLRARLTLLLLTILCGFAGLSTVAYLTSSREEDTLQRAFAEELGFVSELPGLRAILRQIDADSDAYLLTRRGEWLKRRDDSILDFRRRHAEMGGHLTFPAQSREWHDLGRAFDALVNKQNGAIARAQAGRLSRAEAFRLALANDQLNELIERMSRLGRLGFQSLDIRRKAARAAALATFAFVLAIGILGGTLLAAAISRVLVGPVLRLRDQAASWRLGEPWPENREDAPREVRELMQAMRLMAGSLNEQYERERATSRLKSQLVSGVSHEFNNALAVIHTAHALLQESSRPDEAAPWHEMMEANIRALSAMATNLLNLGRLESGRFNLELQRVEPTPLLASALDRLAVLGRRKDLDIRLEAQADLPAVSADADALSLVVANLLTNSFKYTKEGGAVTLGARRRPDGRVEVFVSDTGIGIAPEEREKIFSGYYRTEQGKRTAKGFGVGLALSRMILDAHGSALELESELGKGSRFSFALKPYAAPEKTPGAAA